MDPHGLRNRVFDVVAGRRYFRNWLQETVESLAAPRANAPARASARDVT